MHIGFCYDKCRINFQVSKTVIVMVLVAIVTAVVLVAMVTSCIDCFCRERTELILL